MYPASSDSLWNTIPAVPPAPSVAYVTPNQFQAGDTGTVTVTGLRFDSSASITVNGFGISISNTQLSGNSSLTATYSVSPYISSGTLDLTVTTSSGTSLPYQVSAVAAGPPTVSLAVTGPQSGNTYWVGDTFTVYVRGPKKQSVYVSQNGGGLYFFGNTDDAGQWETSGQWTAANVGYYTQTWYVGSQPAIPSLAFQIVQ